MAGRFSTNSLLGGLSGGALILGNFLSAVISARMLGVEGAGAVAFLVWLVLFIAPIIDLGAASTVARYVPELLARGDIHAASLVPRRLALLLIVSLIVCTFAFLGSTPFIEWYYWLVPAQISRDNIVLVVATLGAYTCFQVMGNFGNAYLRGKQAFKLISLISVASFGLQTTAVTVGATAIGVPGALLGYATGQVLLAAVALRCLKPHRDAAVSAGLQARIQRYAFFAWLSNIANAIVWSRIEVFFLERSWGSEAVGIFTSALALTSLATQGPLLCTIALLPKLSEQHGRNDIEAIHATCATGTRLLAVVVFPCCFGTAALMPVLLPLIYGPAFAAAVPIASMLVCAAALTATSAVGTNLVLAMERNDFIVLSSIFGAGFAVVASSLLIPAFGVWGATGTRAAIQMLLVALGVWFIRSRLQCRLPAEALGRTFLAATVCAIVAASCVQIIGGTASIIPAIVGGAAVYLMALRLVRAVPVSDIILLKRASKMLPFPLGYISIRLVSFIEPQNR